MALQGKGFFIWKIKNCEGGNPEQIALQAQTANLSHVIIKVADGGNTYNIDPGSLTDMVAPLVAGLHEKGIQAWGWQYIYGRETENEIKAAVNRITSLELDGFVINAEDEFKTVGMGNAARSYCQGLRQRITDIPIALSSYRFPRTHPQFPWGEFLDICDYNMPQVYWLKAHDSAAQLRRSNREFQTITPVKPIIPTASTFRFEDWIPSQEEAKNFLLAARELNLEASNFYSWDACRSDSALWGVWGEISRFEWPHTPVNIETDICVSLFHSMNQGDLTAILNLYQPDAVHITSARTIQGQEPIRAWYNTLLTSLLPQGKFTINHVSKAGNSHHFHWTALSSAGKVNNGSDTIGIKDGKIAYHYSSFKITPP